MQRIKAGLSSSSAEASSPSKTSAPKETNANWMTLGLTTAEYEGRHERERTRESSVALGACAVAVSGDSYPRRSTT